MDGLDEAAMVVADDEPDTTESALDEGADEGRPRRPFVVPRCELQAEDASFPVHAHAGGHERRHRDDPTTLADLQIGGIQPKIRIALVGERAGTEGLHLGVERGTHPADLALAHRGDAEGLDEILHPTGGHAGHVRLLDHREQGPLGPSSGLEQAGEVAAVTDPGDGQVDRAHPRVPASLAIAVAAGQAVFGVALTMGHAGDLGDLGFHDRLGQHPQALPQEIHVPITDRLAYRLEQRHPVLGHRVLLFVVGSLLPTTRG